MKTARSLMTMAVVGLAVAAMAVAFAGSPAYAAAFIEWNPETGFYLTETAGADAELRLVAADDGELEAIFHVLRQMRIEEQNQLVLRLRLEVQAGQGPAVVQIERVLDVVDPARAEQIRAELRLREREQLQAQQDREHDDGDRANGDEDEQDLNDRSREQAAEPLQVELKVGQQAHTQLQLGSPSGSSGPASSADDEDDGDSVGEDDEDDHDDGGGSGAVHDDDDGGRGDGQHRGGKGH